MSKVTFMKFAVANVIRFRTVYYIKIECSLGFPYIFLYMFHFLCMGVHTAQHLPDGAGLGLEEINTLLSQLKTDHCEGVRAEPGLAAKTLFTAPSEVSSRKEPGAVIQTGQAFQKSQWDLPVGQTGSEAM